MSDMFSVAEQVVFVSGGSRGIGRAIAKGFADAGATVIITGRDAANLEQTAKEISGTIEVTPLRCDVASEDSINSAVAAALDQFGRVDTLLNVAGVNRRMPAVELTAADFDFIVDINLRGAFLLSLALGKHMLQRGQGNQINIGSLNNDKPLNGVLPYAMSKAGLAHMTRVLAMEWAEQGVRVNAIGPGFILTDLTQKLWSNPKMQEWGRFITPMRRLGRPEDMVGAALFLASDASAFITGQMLYVDGGVSAGMNWPIEYSKQ